MPDTEADEAGQDAGHPLSDIGPKNCIKVIDCPCDGKCGGIGVAFTGVLFQVFDHELGQYLLVMTALPANTARQIAMDFLAAANKIDPTGVQ